MKQIHNEECCNRQAEGGFDLGNFKLTTLNSIKCDNLAEDRGRNIIMAFIRGVDDCEMGAATTTANTVV